MALEDSPGGQDVYDAWEYLITVYQNDLPYYWETALDYANESL